MADKQQESLFNLHLGLNGRSIMMFQGPYGKNAMTLFDCYFGDLLNERPVVKKRVMTVFIEIAQNINNYSIERQKTIDGSVEGVGYVSISKNAEGYSIIGGNLTTQENANKLKKAIEKINSNLNRDALHELKRTLWKQDVNNTEGSNIGLVESALASQNDLKLEIKDADELSNDKFITLKIDIKA